LTNAVTSSGADPTPERVGSPDTGGPHRSRDGGFATIQFVLATGLALLFLVLVANIIVFQYGRGVVRAATDEAARAGSLAAGSDAERVEACGHRADDVLDDLLSGPLGDGVAVSCSVEYSGPVPVVTARADVTFRSWIDPVPDWSFTATAVAVSEEEP